MPRRRRSAFSAEPTSQSTCALACLEMTTAKACPALPPPQIVRTRVRSPEAQAFSLTRRETSLGHGVLACRCRSLVQSLHIVPAC